MSYQLKVEPKPGFLHATVTGVNNRSNVEGYLKEVLRECVERKCFRVLIEEHLDGPRLGIMDVFEIAVQGSRDAFGLMQAIACVDANAEGDLMRFGQTVANNR